MANWGLSRPPPQKKNQQTRKDFCNCLIMELKNYKRKQYSELKYDFWLERGAGVYVNLIIRVTRDSVFLFVTVINTK